MFFSAKTLALLSLAGPDLRRFFVMLFNAIGPVAKFSHCQVSSGNETVSDFEATKYTAYRSFSLLLHFEIFCVFRTSAPHWSRDVNSSGSGNVQPVSVSSSSDFGSERALIIVINNFYS